MNARFRLQKTDLFKNFRAPLTVQHSRRILGRMSAIFKAEVMANFGVSGRDRPSPWAPLSKRYSKRVRRTSATLDTDIGRSPYRDGRTTGRLHRSVKTIVGNTSASVFTNDPIAEVHQFGIGKNPKRPFFPMYDNGEPTPMVKAKMMKAGQDELNLIIQRKLPAAIY